MITQNVKLAAKITPEVTLSGAIHQPVGSGLPNVVITSIPSLQVGGYGKLSESESEAFAAVASAKTGCTITLSINDDDGGTFHAVLPTSVASLGSICVFVAPILAFGVLLYIAPDDMGGAGYVWGIDEIILPNADNAVLYTEQNLTEEQKAQARKNIGVSTSGGLSITDDGEGNVSIISSGAVTITDDGNGNVVIA